VSDGVATGSWRVLVVEDEPVALEAHAAYVARVPGFEVAATAPTAREALRVLAATPVDVVLLDMNLPDGHGLDVVRAMRAAGSRADVIAVTSARELEVVRAAVSQGVVQYILKPFVFATLVVQSANKAEMTFLNHNGIDVETQQEVDDAHKIIEAEGAAWGVHKLTKPNLQHGTYSFYFWDCDDNAWEILSNPKGGYTWIFEQGDLAGRGHFAKGFRDKLSKTEKA